MVQSLNSKKAATKTPTARELVAAKQAQAAPLAPKTTAVARTDNRDHVARYLDECAPSGLVGRLIKFSKDGVFITQDDGQEIPGDAEFAVLADQTLVGWLKFNGEGVPPDPIMGLLYDGFVMPRKEDLPDRDESTWEDGLDGKPADPWVHHQYLVLQHTGTAELFTYDAGNKTGRRAVSTLLKHYDRMRKTHPGEVPVVRLRTGGYNHPDSRVGWVNVPVFVACGRRPADSVAKPSSTAALIGDELPPFV